MRGIGPSPSISKRIATGSLWTIGGVSVTAVFEYAYFVYAGHILPSAAFGILSATVALLSILTIFATYGIGTSLARFVALHSSSESRTRYVASGLAMELAVAVGFGGVVGAVALLAPSGSRIGDMRGGLVIVALVFPVIVISTMFPVVLQGLERLRECNFALASNAIARFLGLLVLLWFSRRVEMAIAAYAVGGFVVIVYCVRKLRHLIRLWALSKDKMLELLGFSVPVTVATAVTGMFTRSDVLLLKLLSIEDVNLVVASFTVPSMLGRGLFHLASAVPIALLPVISASIVVPRRDLIRLLTIVLSGFAVAVLLSIFAAEPLVSFLFPSELTDLSWLLTPYIAAMAFLSMASILTAVLIASGRPQIAANAMIVGFLLFVGLSWWLVPGGGVPYVDGPAGLVTALLVGSFVASVLQVPGFLLVTSSPGPSD